MVKIMTKKTRKEWEEIAEDIADRVLGAVDYFCWNVSGDTPADCYAAHQDLDLFDLANEFIGYSYNISEEDVKALEEMPDDIYEKYNKYVKERIEKAALENMKEARKIERELKQKGIW